MTYVGSRSVNPSPHRSSQDPALTARSGGRTWDGEHLPYIATPLPDPNIDIGSAKIEHLRLKATPLPKGRNL